MEKEDNKPATAATTSTTVPLIRKRRGGANRRNILRKGIQSEDTSEGKVAAKTSTDSSSDDEDETTETLEETRSILQRKRPGASGRLRRKDEEAETNKTNGKDSVNKDASTADIDVQYAADLSVTGDSLNTSTVSIPKSEQEDRILGRSTNDVSLSSARGTAYTDFLPKRESYNKKAHAGPVTPSASSAALRTVTIVDYQPDVCKDYKQTGYCGYGDSCKFLHDREDYKAGWQIDREWELVQQRKRRPGQQESAGSEPDGDKTKKEETIPFVCLICKQDYKNPIVTSCKHHFCELCAIKRFRKTPTCAQCGSDTKGLFSVDKQFNILIKKREEAKQQKGEQAREDNGEEPLERTKQETAPPSTSTNVTTPSSVTPNRNDSPYYMANLTESNISDFKRLIQVLLGMNYGKRFYKECLASPSLAKTAYVGDLLVGAIRCTHLPEEESLYIAVLGVLAPYRRLGIGQQLLEHVKQVAKQMGVGKITLHVQTCNEDAIAWYQHRGFRTVKRIENCYVRLAVKSAYQMVLDTTTAKQDV
ncbi:zf-C3HC4 type /GCN5-like N acetyltransferase fusion protein [Schizosaccharomyces japonicus yFS275]|uniref:Zf-C3HC4 type /GCN5-like N acetyltransferase fusion protein n=1 Tax=Schizosaccharomyces japonicus (strain yFS275 / FY16936) TaxID=402676 RepID=B6K3C8_SCHJY|nr:zf-C3HC4 type /GCN5-like N acetyltransferase fusion protein [Schizosaccharomyces japonicus yFS275]EEB07985.1 zf-C3HC4 type /GCN5-like N acetyltransferase fusion protein [Schizosaccharomyces japonicus yFS275]